MTDFKLLDELNLPNNAENRYLLIYNEPFLAHWQELYRLHITYPNLYFSSRGNMGRYLPLIVEPPPRVLETLETWKAIEDFHKTYDFVWTHNGDFDFSRYTPYPQKPHDPTHYGTLLYMLNHNKIHKINEDFWYTSEGISSPLTWILRNYPVKLQDLLCYYEYYQQEH